MPISVSPNYTLSAELVQELLGSKERLESLMDHAGVRRGRDFDGPILRFGNGVMINYFRKGLQSVFMLSCPQHQNELKIIHKEIYSHLGAGPEKNAELAALIDVDWVPPGRLVGATRRRMPYDTQGSRILPKDWLDKDSHILHCEQVVSFFDDKTRLEREMAARGVHRGKDFYGLVGEFRNGAILIYSRAGNETCFKFFADARQRDHIRSVLDTSRQPSETLLRLIG